MRWRRGDGRNIISGNGYVIRHDRDAHGVDTYHAYAPPGSISVDIESLRRIAEVFGSSDQDVEIARRAARMKIGAFFCPEQARDQCDKFDATKGRARLAKPGV